MTTRDDIEAFTPDEVDAVEALDREGRRMTSAPLITIRPGPVLHVWQGGREIAVVPMTQAEALCLLRDLADEIGRASSPAAGNGADQG